MESKSVPRISINIPIYNGEKTIARAVQSMLSQSFTDFELIVLNDCSKDSTPQILNEFNDPRMRVIHHEQNQGISRTRNDMLRESRAKYIAVLDGDDFALPTRLEKQIAAMEKDSTLSGVFSWVNAYKGDDPYDTFATYSPKRDAGGMRELVLFESPFQHSTAFVRRDVMTSGYREDLKCAEDYAKWLELVFTGHRLGVVQEILGCGWFHPPTFYTREKMRANVMALQGEIFARLLGRPMTAEESESQWSLYETIDWMPKSREEANEHLQRVRRWVDTLHTADLCDKSIDRVRFAREARTRYYLLCNQALKHLGLNVLGFSRGLTVEQRLKLLVKAAIR